MKLGIFTDSHYSSAELTCGVRRNNMSLGKIERAYEHFKKESCDLIVCLGDLLDTEPSVEMEIENLKQIAKIVKNCDIPSVFIMGNHDAFTLSPEEFYKNLGTEPPHDIKTDGKNLIFLDACYLNIGRHYAPGDHDWTDTYYPHTEELYKKLKEARGDTYIFVHQNIDPTVSPDHRISNSDDILHHINESGVVKAVFQGHCHWGSSYEEMGVKYITLPAMCEKEDGFFIFDI